MSGKDCSTKNPQPLEEATRRTRRGLWNVRRVAPDMTLIQMILDHHHAVRMIRIRDHHWKPPITTDNSAPGAALDLEDQGQEGDEGKVHHRLEAACQDRNSHLRGGVRGSLPLL